MWRGNIDIIGFSLGRTLSMKADVHQYNVSLSDIQVCLNRARPFLSSVQKRESFPHVSVKFFRSNNGQWEFKKKIEASGSESHDLQGHVLR